jgi:hypothetical protein
MACKSTISLGSPKGVRMRFGRLDFSTKKKKPIRLSTTLLRSWEMEHLKTPNSVRDCFFVFFCLAMVRWQHFYFTLKTLIRARLKSCRRNFDVQVKGSIENEVSIFKDVEIASILVCTAFSSSRFVLMITMRK